MARIATRVVAAWAVLGWVTVAWAVPPEAEVMVFKLTPPADTGLQPVVFKVPSGYAPAQEAMHQTEGASLSVLAMYPSYAPFVAGPGRCGTMMCGDEVGAKVELAKAGPAGRVQAGTLRSEMEVKYPLGGDTVLTDTAVPDGYEEAFTVERAALPGRDYTYIHVEYLVYRDKQGVQRVGSCSMKGAHPSCSFRSFDPATGIVLTYNLPRTDLANRDTIEAGLRMLFSQWRVPGP